MLQMFSHKIQHMTQIFIGLCSRGKVSLRGLGGPVISLTFKYLMNLLDEARNLVRQENILENIQSCLFLSR